MRKFLTKSTPPNPTHPNPTPPNPTPPNPTPPNPTPPNPAPPNPTPPNPAPPNPIPPVVDLDPEPAAPTPPPNTTSPQCPLACCDTSTPVSARLAVNREQTAQGEGKRKRYFNPDWLDQFKWLVLCKTTRKGFCQICRYAIQNQLPTFAKYGEPAFTTSGFTNWKKGKDKFASHQQSEFHRECHMKTTQLQNATPINTQLTDNLKVQFYYSRH